MSTFEGGRVEDFGMDGSFPGSDQHDAHVHAAAVACGADYVLSCDRGLQEAAAEDVELPHEVYAPDEFFLLIDECSPIHVREATLRQTLYWLKKSGKASMAEHLEKAGCPQFAQRVRQYQTRLSLPKDLP
ncbi:hypothetical protein [Thermocrispum sp.]|uniref:PIN domain-containing protein n=1 Tax=Thermocrispum agreste TaxID=37925 RepID=A0ABD6FB75_9PSEU|nr:hypothetical protein [Thermocrispum sp.]